MLFDPDAGRTTEEILRYKWDHEWTAEFKARIEEIAVERGCSWFEMLCEWVKEVLEDLEDPITRQRLEAKWDRQEQPFGTDPRLKS